MAGEGELSAMARQSRSASQPAGDAAPADPHVEPAQADTPTRLLQAAMAEFIEAGFAGTDTNRIARRAGFAPQTFYRWFADKTAILIEVLRVWEEVERAVVQSLFEARDMSPLELAQLAEACVENIRPFLTFRRNLRTVASTHAEIRAARAAGRQRLLDRLAQWNPRRGRDELAALLVQFEQLCEVVAEGEFEDLGASDDVAMATLAGLIESMRG
ncbi:MAG: helix-turn-helix domain-containing protein [Aquabacterium sp.]